MVFKTYLNAFVGHELMAVSIKVYDKRLKEIPVYNTIYIPVIWQYDELRKILKHIQILVWG